MSLGIPYMGSKRKIANKIVDYIIQSNPNAKYYYDLFGGGGAISFELLKRGKTVFYNELNTGVVKLLEKIRDDGVTPEFYKWVDRETFNNHKNDDTWHGGLLATCWSFGNNKDKGYLYSKDIEYIKKLLHYIVVYKCYKSLDIFNGMFNLEITINNYENNAKRRINIEKFLSKSLTSKNINDIGKFVDIQKGKEVYTLIESFIRIQQLEKFKNVKNINRLNISNKSAFDVEITTPINETIIYFDPPYIGKAKYSKDILHDELYEYINKSPYKIYMSSYEAPFECVFELSHKSSLSATNNGKKVVEKLFCNQEEKTKGTLF